MTGAFRGPAGDPAARDKGAKHRRRYAERIACTAFMRRTCARVCCPSHVSCSRLSTCSSPPACALRASSTAAARRRATPTQAPASAPPTPGFAQLLAAAIARRLAELERSSGEASPISREDWSVFRLPTADRQHAIHTHSRASPPRQWRLLCDAVMGRWLLLLLRPFWHFSQKQGGKCSRAQARVRPAGALSLSRLTCCQPGLERCCSPNLGCDVRAVVRPYIFQSRCYHMTASLESARALAGPQGLRLSAASLACTLPIPTPPQSKASPHAYEPTAGQRQSTARRCARRSPPAGGPPPLSRAAANDEARAHPPSPVTTCCSGLIEAPAPECRTLRPVDDRKRSTPPSEHPREGTARHPSARPLAERLPPFPIRPSEGKRWLCGK